MRKIIAFTMVCFLSLMLKNEKAICKSNCDVVNKARIAHSPVINEGVESEPGFNSLQPYDGFFKKL